MSLLLVEDDPMVRRSLQLALSRHGYHVEVAATGDEGLTAFHQHHPDLIVLDLMLPGIDGFEVCRQLRQHSQTPIIMLTARGDDLDVVGGLEAGADDYVVKPVQPAVLDARIRAVLRRTVSDPEGIRTHSGLRIDTESLSVTLHGADVLLTPTELRLLLTLSRTPERVFTRQQLLEEVWEHGYLGDSRLVDNGVLRLRAKIEADPARVPGTFRVFVASATGLVLYDTIALHRAVPPTPRPAADPRTARPARHRFYSGRNVGRRRCRIGRHATGRALALRIQPAAARHHA